MYKYFVLIVMAFALAGCAHAPQSPQAGQGEQVGDQPSAPMAKQSLVSLPEGWPEDVLMYPDGVIEGTGSGPAGMKVHQVTGDTLEKIRTWYDAEMRRLGWESVRQNDLAGWLAVYQKREETREVEIAVLLKSGRPAGEIPIIVVYRTVLTR